MKLITIKKDLLSAYSRIDGEVLQKYRRPVVLVIRLKYKGIVHDFAVPFRSNIPPSTPKNEYFALPPRNTTKPKHHHGLHYTKMFPVTNQSFERYRTEGDIASTMYLAIIDKNEKAIVDGCQAYLDRYAKGDCPSFSTDLDDLLSCCNSFYCK